MKNTIIGLMTVTVAAACASTPEPEPVVMEAVSISMPVEASASTLAVANAASFRVHLVEEIEKRQAQLDRAEAQKAADGAILNRESGRPQTSEGAAAALRAQRNWPEIHSARAELENARGDLAWHDEQHRNLDAREAPVNMQE